MENWPNDSAGCDVLTNTNAGQTHSRMCQCSMTDVIDGFSLSTEAYKACMAMHIYIYIYMDTLWSLN